MQLGRSALHNFIAFSCSMSGYCQAPNAGTQLLKSQIHELPWAPPAGAAAGGSGIVILAQDAACAGKDFSLTGSCSSTFHPPCAWKEEKATTTTAKLFLMFKGKRVAAGAGETSSSQSSPLGRQLVFGPICEILRGKQTLLLLHFLPF